VKRRQALQSLAGISVAGALPLPAPSQQQPAARTIAETPKFETAVPDAAAEGLHLFFSADQFAALERLAEVLMPAVGDSPGAQDTGVAEFLDFLISASPADRQAQYRDGLDKLNAVARSRYRKTFVQLAPAEIDTLLAPLREAWTFASPADSLAQFLRAAKMDVMHATMNSRQWSEARAKRSRRASGLGMYWYPIE
jgi:Gluconate 2-dehydrogenase subunit 3